MSDRPPSAPPAELAMASALHPALEGLAVPAPARVGPRWAAAQAALLLGVGVATVAGLVGSDGNPAVALAPIGLAALLYAVAILPVRWPAAALLLVMLAVDDKGESYGQWRTPLAKLGDMLHYRLDEAAGIPGAAVSGMELAIALLLGIWVWRRATGARADLDGQVEAASVLRDLLLVYVAGVLFSAAWGVARGLPIAPWKIRNLLHPILLALLFLSAFRGPLDHRLLGRIVVAAACVKAALAFVVQRLSIAQTGGKWETATSHGDSVLFAVAAFLLVAGWLEEPGRRRLLRLALLLPIVLVGAIENERRIVWVMLAMALVLAYLVAPMRRWKRELTRVLLLSLPLLALYVGVGWNRTGKVFAPVQTLRSVADSSVDRSAYWREVEIWNIAMSTRWSPLLGIGLGGEYTEYMLNDNIADAYKEYREWPHNTVLGLLMLMGLFAFTAHWVLLPAVVFLAVRSYRKASAPDDRVAALGVLAAVVACLVMAYGDTGAHYPQYKIFVALAVAVAAKLAVHTGAWPARAARPPALTRR